MAVTLLRSVFLGRASGDIGYDDVSYLLSSYRRAEILTEKGTVGFLIDLVQNPPHSFFIEILGATVFSLVGPIHQALYAVHVIIIGLLVLSASKIFLEKTGPAVPYFFSSLFLLSPLGYFLSSQLRPDPTYSLVLAIIIGGWGSAQLMQKKELKKSTTWVAVALSSLLYIKPSFFILTSLLMVSMLIFRFWLHKLTPIMEAEKKFLLVWLLSTVPFWVIGFPPVLRYVLQNMLGDNASFWVVDNWLVAFLSSVGNAVILGIVPILVSISILSVGFFGPARVDVQTLRQQINIRFSVLALTMVSLGVLAIRSPSTFFGLMPVVSAVFLLAALALPSLRRLRMQSVPRFSQILGPRVEDIRKAHLIAFLFVVTISGVPPLPKHYQYADTSPPISINKVAYTAVLEFCERVERCSLEYLQKGVFPPTLIATTSALEAGSFQWVATREGWETREIRVLPLGSESDDISDYLNATEFVILADSNSRLLGNFPVNSHQSNWLGTLDKSPDWSRLNIPRIAGEYAIFSRFREESLPSLRPK